MNYSIKLIIRIILCFISIIFYRAYYFVFGPLTLRFTESILSLFTHVTVSENMLYVGEYSLRFVDACVAASAYILITLLVLFTRKISFDVRLKMLGLGYLFFFIFNALRIQLLLVILLFFGHNIFNAVHMILWTIVSTIFVFLIWIMLIKIFNIKSIPVYSDIKYLISKIKK